MFIVYMYNIITISYLSMKKNLYLGITFKQGKYLIASTFVVICSDPIDQKGKLECGHRVLTCSREHIKKN